MKLYYSPGACSLSPHIVSREAGIELELRKVNTKEKTVEGGGDFWKVNPKGYVPALELDDGTVLTEGPAIVQYLADRVPERGLAPAAGTMARVRLQEWLNFISTELHKGFSPLFVPAMPEEAKALFRLKLQERLQWVDAQLEGRAFLLGDAFSVADAYLFVVSGWGGLVGVDIAPYRQLVAYRERIAARPAVQAALKAEGLLK